MGNPSLDLYMTFQYLMEPFHRRAPPPDRVFGGGLRQLSLSRASCSFAHDAALECECIDVLFNFNCR